MQNKISNTHQKGLFENLDDDIHDILGRTCIKSSIFRVTPLGEKSIFRCLFVGFSENRSENFKKIELSSITDAASAHKIIYVLLEIH